MARGQPNLQRAVDAWNRDISVGQKVAYRRDDGSLVQTTTRTEASVLSGHTAVIWLDGVRGCVALDRVSPS